MLSALIESAPAAGVTTEQTAAYQGRCEWLVTGPLGDPTRYDAFKRHRAAGGRTLICDLGYWRRKITPGEDRLMRFAIDAPHCQNMLFLGPADPSRLTAHGIGVRDTYDKDGHIVIVGLGPKGARWAGLGMGEFEARALEMCRRRWPDREVVYRPKIRNGVVCHKLSGVDRTATDPDISTVLDGASLVVNQHSNAGVDAVIQGIPLLSEDGAACALSGEGLDRTPRVIPISERSVFLQHLACWQWSQREAAQGKVWSWLRGVLENERVGMVA